MWSSMSDLLDVRAKLRYTVEPDPSNIAVAAMSEDRECLKGRKSGATELGCNLWQGESTKWRKLVKSRPLEIIKKNPISPYSHRLSM